MKKKRKPCIKGRCFYNTPEEVPESLSSFFIRSALMFLKTFFIRRKSKSDVASWVQKSCPLSCSVNPVITWIGHSSFLIQVGGVNILTDPIFGSHTCIFSRVLEAGISFDEMPNIDFVLISHNHPDHMDRHSLIKLKEHKETSFLVPLGDKAWFDRRSFVRVKEHTWWEPTNFKIASEKTSDITFTFLPSNHWSLRGLFDKNRSLWGSWMIEYKGVKIYFGGDSAYDSHFSEIGDVFPGIEVALLPIAPGEPRRWLKHSHLDSVEAGRSFLDLRAKHFIPMHWGTFTSGAELFDDPIILLEKWWGEQSDDLKGKMLHLPKIGQQLTFDFF